MKSEAEILRDMANQLDAIMENDIECQDGCGEEVKEEITEFEDESNGYRVSISNLGGTLGSDFAETEQGAQRLAMDLARDMVPGDKITMEEDWSEDPGSDRIEHEKEQAIGVSMVR